MNKTVIIGGVAGGASCAARLRRLDEDAQIVLLERGEYISYANCGLPYHVGNVIKSRDALLLQTPQAMNRKFNVDVRVRNEVTAIDKDKKQLTVHDHKTGTDYTEDYDTLVISTGSSPLRPPIPGIDSPRIQTLWTVPDTDRIRSLIETEDIHSAVVIGGGFIGLEMAENLHQTGIDVTIVEMLDQVMAPLDYEMAQLLHENMVQNGVTLDLGDGVKAFETIADGKQVRITLNSGRQIETDLVILAIGVRPNGELARDAGLEVNARGGIVTDEYLKTSDPDIYAVGDVIEVEDRIFGDRTMIPLAGPANKQGRIAADNIAGGHSAYNGSQGTSVAKVFDMTAASTGANEKSLKKHGLEKEKDYQSIIISQNSHAGYYPGAVPMSLKLLFSPDGSKIFGAQIVGRDGVDKRIDTLAAVIRLGGSIQDLKELELAYAPPYSSAKDPVNMAGFVAGNLIDGLVRFSDWDVTDHPRKPVLLDVREDAEVNAFSVNDAVHITLGSLRDRYTELDPEKETVIFCAVGVRAYNAARILMQKGFQDVRVYPGGTRFYMSTHYPDYPAPISRPKTTGNSGSGFLQETGEQRGSKSERTPGEPGGDSDPSSISSSGVPLQIKGDNMVKAKLSLDCSGLQCPGPIMKVYEAMNELKDGEAVEVTASDPGFARDIDSWCRRTGNCLVSNEHRGNDYTALVQKQKAPAPAAAAEIPQGKTMIVFSGDLDKVLASFIIANGAAAMGRPVTMFFTFWGLTALRKPQKQPVHKTLVEAMFGAMLPRGTGKLRLSRMNMGGLGTAMMKKIMNDKNVDSLETLIRKAMDNGVKIVACTMSMDVMGIKKEELIDGVELGGVGAYLGDAEESNVNLFI
ncbi:MAG: FAD-dependent oxidoreductase [Eubacteriaceae bacterium]|jgi:NADPH-dependent 2,4-dienoyl-CoA reductase/sulfur reductase-like enzyme/peroxiredoxin family protein/TusA-related sulfurtransferase/rhodanese-related sulfurtransferase